MTRRRNKGSSPSFTALTAKELSGFDTDARELILTAIDVGCTGRVSRKGHAILRNNTGATAAVSRHMSTQNRTSQNAHAQIKLLLNTHRREDAPRQEPVVSPAASVSVNQALTDYAMEFSNWLSRESVEAAPADLVHVTARSDGTHDFALEPETMSGGHRYEQAEAEQNPPVDSGENDDHTSSFMCPDCRSLFPSMQARNAHLGGHTSTHLRHIAEFNHMTPARVRDHLRKAGTPMHEGHYELTENSLAAVGLAFSYECHLCPSYSRFHSGLRRHVTRRHEQPTLAELASTHEMEEDEMAALLEAGGALLSNGVYDRDPRTLVRLGLAPPVQQQHQEEAEPEPVMLRAVPDPTEAEEVSTADETLEKIRAALGPDPRIAELETEVTHHKERADLFETQLALIKDTLSA